MKKLIILLLFSTLSYSQMQYVEYDIAVYTNVNDLENVYGKVKLKTSFIYNHTYVGLGYERERVSFLGGWYKSFGRWEINNDISVGWTNGETIDKSGLTPSVDLELTRNLYKDNINLFRNNNLKAGVLFQVIRQPNKVIEPHLFLGLGYKF